MNVVKVTKMNFKVTKVIKEDKVMVKVRIKYHSSSSI